MIDVETGQSGNDGAGRFKHRIPPLHDRKVGREALPPHTYCGATGRVSFGNYLDSGEAQGLCPRSMPLSQRKMKGAEGQVDLSFDALSLRKR